MTLGYKYFRNKWIQLCILTVGLGAFVWAAEKGEAKVEPGVVPLVVSIAVVGHLGLITLMVRAKKKEEQEKQAVLTTILTGKSTTEEGRSKRPENNARDVT